MNRIKAGTMARIQYLQGEAQELAELLADLSHEAQETYDTRTEKWQESDKAEAFQEWADTIEAAHQAAQDAADSVGDITAAPE